MQLSNVVHKKHYKTVVVDDFAGINFEGVFVLTSRCNKIVSRDHASYFWVDVTCPDCLANKSYKQNLRDQKVRKEREGKCKNL